MSPVRNQLVEMIDLMPEAEQLLLLEIARRFVPDDAAAPETTCAPGRRSISPRPAGNTGKAKPFPTTALIGVKALVSSPVFPG